MSTKEAFLALGALVLLSSPCSARLRYCINNFTSLPKTAATLHYLPVLGKGAVYADTLRGMVVAIPPQQGPNELEIDFFSRDSLLECITATRLLIDATDPQRQEMDTVFFPGPDFCEKEFRISNHFNVKSIYFNTDRSLAFIRTCGRDGEVLSIVLAECFFKWQTKENHISIDWRKLAEKTVMDNNDSLHSFEEVQWNPRLVGNIWETNVTRIAPRELCGYLQENKRDTSLVVALGIAGGALLLVLGVSGIWSRLNSRAIVHPIQE